MFKGIVIEIKEDYIIVMKEDSTLTRIKKKDKLRVGTTIFFFEEDIYVKKSNAKVIPFKKYLIPLTAIAALFMILINPMMRILSPVENNSYAVLTFDVNPSIEFELDENGVITEVKGINNDGIALGLDKIKGMTFEAGAVKLKEILSENNYLSNNNAVLVGFSFLGNEDISYEERIQNAIKNTFKGTDVAFLKGQKSDLEKAESKGITLGKYEALLKLNEDNFEDAIENLTTQEILDLLKNADNTIFLNEDKLEEIQEELEDRIEEETEEQPEEAIKEETQEDVRDDSSNYVDDDIDEEDDDKQYYDNQEEDDDNQEDEIEDSDD